MNKKFKIVSSIALAGMLLTGSLGMNRVNAAEQTSVEDNYTTNPVGIYRKLVEGKTVVPFILANIDDVLTVRDIVNSEKFEGTVERVNGNTVSALDLPVGTGDTFTTTDGTEYTVVVYGDVDGNGRINPDDALEVDKYYLDLVSLNDAQKEAADVDDGNAGNINPDDSLRIRKYYVDLETSVIDNLPPAEEVVQESNYSMTVNKGGYINNVNEKNSSVEISLKETLAKDATLKLVISDQDEDTADKEQNIKITAHMDYVTASGIDLSGLKDGTVTASLYDGDKLVAKYEIVMNTDNAPNTASVRTNRVSTREATLSLESMGESNVTKVRYILLDKDATEPQVKELTNSLDVQNNKLTDAIIASELETNTVYRVWYIVENEYGSISGMNSALITTDKTLTTEPKLAEVKAPDLTKEAVAEFELIKDEEKGEASSGYVVTLYKDGVAIAEKDVPSLMNVSFTSEIAKAGVGTYRVSVVAKGNAEGTSEASEAVESAEVTVTALKTVENLTIENLENDAEGNAIISWENPNGKDDFGAYEIDLYTVDAEGEETLAQDNVACDNDKNEVKVRLTPNTIYVAKVKLAAKADQMAVINSEEVVSDQFYIVEAPDVYTATTTKGSTSIKFDVEPIEIANKEVTYKVEVFTSKENGNMEDGFYQKVATKDVTIDENDQVTVDGLNPTTDYAFRLVAVVDGNEVKSGYSGLYTTLPVFEGVTVTNDVDAAMVEGSNKVALKNTNTIVMNGAEYDTTYITELAKARTVIDSLEAGDVVTMNDDATDVSIVLDGRAEDRTFTTGDIFKDSTVEITSNAFTKTLVGKFKALTLGGAKSIFDVDGVEMTGENKDIVLTDAIEVTAETKAIEYKVEAGANVIINDIEVSTDEEMTLTARTGKNLDVDANTTENDVTFENTTAGNAVIKFIGSPDNTSEQRGTITIKTTNGKVIVKAPQVNVSAEMTVEVTNGKVDIKDPSLTGDKTVTVSADKDKSSKVFANTVVAAPEVLKTNKKLTEIELKDYSDEEIRKTFGDKNGEMAQNDVIAVREYINSFGVNGKGVKVTVDADDLNLVTIEVPGKVQGITIGNLK